MKDEIDNVFGGFEISIRYTVTSIKVCGPFGTLSWKKCNSNCKIKNLIVHCIENTVVNF